MRIDIHGSTNLCSYRIAETWKKSCGAVRGALLERKRAGNSIASWEEGKVVMIEADEIPVEDPLREERIQ
jgi:hypothetical protein